MEASPATAGVKLSSQVWTLTKKNLCILLLRHPLSTSIRSFLGPVLFMYFICYSKNLFVPPSKYGIGSATPVRSFAAALAASTSGRDTVAFINNGFTDGDIAKVIDDLAGQVKGAGKTSTILAHDVDLLGTCPSSLNGVSPCFAAVNFHSSPTLGSADIWNYTISVDGALGIKVYADRHDNDVEVYLLPFQRAIDAAIASSNGSAFPDTVLGYPFTSKTEDERKADITRSFMSTLINILAVSFFVGMCGIVYHLTGRMALERELGMSQLIEAMMPNERSWQPQAARLLSMHLSFDLIYLPGWLVIGLIVHRLAFPDSNAAIVIIFHILAGMSLTSWSLVLASFFRKAQLSGIFATLFSIILAIIVQVHRPESSGGIALLCLLFAPMNYVFFIIYMAYWQKKSRGANIVKSAPGAPWGLPGIAFWILAILHLFLLPILAAYIEKWRHTTASKQRIRQAESSESGPAIELRSFSKHFYPSSIRRKFGERFNSPKDTVIAVQGVSFDVLQGQITVLLGANGSGKSTTLDAIVGLQNITEGTINIYGSSGLGYCPQKNVLWDELTVMEHLRIFERLKSPGRPSKVDMASLAESCDLTAKLSAKAGTLSGGQKRKLQLAIMFAGGSKICCVDEVSSGLDPISRRKIWNILLAQRGLRTIILTTHFLDEADLLSDHIVMLSKGRLVASGSAVELKHQFGNDYRLRVPKQQLLQSTMEWTHLPKSDDTDHVTFQLTDAPATTSFMSKLEAAGLNDYEVSGPSIEDVFLKLAQEVQSEHVKESPSDAGTISEGLNLSVPRKINGLQQSWQLFKKRLTILKRNYLPYLSALILPIATAGLVTLYIKDFTALSCLPQDLVTESDVSSFAFYSGVDVPVGPPDVVNIDKLISIPSDLSASSFHAVGSFDAFTKYISTNYSHANPGGLFTKDKDGHPTMAYKLNDGVIYPVLVQNILHNILTGSSTVASVKYFDFPWKPSAGKSLQLVLYFGLAMCVFPAFFVLYTNFERRTKVRALHYSNGVMPASLWIAHIAYDTVFIFVISAVAISVFVGASKVWYEPGLLFLVFLLYGIAATLLGYIVSLFAKSQLSAFAITAGGHCSLFLGYFIAYMCIITYSPPKKLNHYVNIAHFTIAAFAPSGNLLRALLLTLNEFSLLCRGRSVVSTPLALDVFGGPILYLILQIFSYLSFLIWWDLDWKPSFARRKRNIDADTEMSDSQLVEGQVREESLRLAKADDPLRVLHVSKRFRNTPAVEDVSFGVRRGEIFALLGPNGAGKSTTISLIRGELRPQRGRGDVLVEGSSIINSRAVARVHLGVCPQFDAMDRMTVLEHLRFYARARGSTDVANDSHAVMRAVGLLDFRDRMAAKLSGGNKRKLSLGIALMGNPSVLLLDEPSSGMDAASKRMMWRTLGAVTAGRSMLLTTHSMEEADALAGRIGIMSQKMLALGATSELRRRHGNTLNVHLVHKDAPMTRQHDMDRINSWILAKFPHAQLERRTFHGQIRFSVPNTPHQVGSEVKEKETERDKDTEKEKEKEKEPEMTVQPLAEPSRSGISVLFQVLEAEKRDLGIEFYSVSQSTLDQVFLKIVGEHNVEEDGLGQGRGRIWQRLTRKLRSVRQGR